MNQEEVWKKIEGFPDYEISNRGNVRNIWSRRIKKLDQVNSNGYQNVGLWNGKDNNFQVHSLVAKHFIDNPNRYSCVGHIDGNNQNNNVENLRWETRSQCGRKQRKQKRETTSIYKGVTFFRRDQKWRAYISKDHKQIHLGYFDTELEAAEAYDKAAKNIYELAKVNFEDKDTTIDKHVIQNEIKQIEKIQCGQNKKTNKQTSSIYKGVAFSKRDQNWVAYITIEQNKKKYLGSFKTEQEAAKTYDEAAKIYFKEFARLNLK